MIHSEIGVQADFANRKGETGNGGNVDISFPYTLF